MKNINRRSAMKFTMGAAAFAVPVSVSSGIHPTALDKALEVYRQAKLDFEEAFLLEKVTMDRWKEWLANQEPFVVTFRGNQYDLITKTGNPLLNLDLHLHLTEHSARNMDQSKRFGTKPCRIDDDYKNAKRRLGEYKLLCAEKRKELGVSYASEKLSSASDNLSQAELTVLATPCETPDDWTKRVKFLQTFTGSFEMAQFEVDALIKGTMAQAELESRRA